MKIFKGLLVFLSVGFTSFLWGDDNRLDHRTLLAKDSHRTLCGDDLKKPGHRTLPTLCGDDLKKPGHRTLGQKRHGILDLDYGKVLVSETRQVKRCQLQPKNQKTAKRQKACADKKSVSKKPRRSELEKFLLLLSRLNLNPQAHKHSQVHNQPR